MNPIPTVDLINLNPRFKFQSLCTSKEKFEISPRFHVCIKFKCTITTYTLPYSYIIGDLQLSLYIVNDFEAGIKV
jgi:hypothetical protein